MSRYKSKEWFQDQYRRNNMTEVEKINPVDNGIETTRPTVYITAQETTAIEKKDMGDTVYLKGSVISKTESQDQDDSIRIEITEIEDG